MRVRPLKNVTRAGAAAIGCVLGVWFFGSRPVPEMVRPAIAAQHGGREELDQLLKARYETAKALLDLEEKRLDEGVTTLGRVCEAARWVRDSAVELPLGAKEQLAALTNYVALTRRLEASVDKAATQGAAPPSDRELARYLRLDAEIMLLRRELRDSQ